MPTPTISSTIFTFVIVCVHLCCVRARVCHGVHMTRRTCGSQKTITGVWPRSSLWGRLAPFFFFFVCFGFLFCFPLSMPEWLLGILAPPQQFTRITDTHAGFLYGCWGFKLRSPHLCWKWFYPLSYLLVSMALNWQIQLDAFHTKQLPL